MGRARAATLKQLIRTTAMPAASWLLSDEASFANGGFHPIDGAFTAA